ncbi:hypothetical protein [uncultured Microbacterium sp.]|uniref:hypothetical protein n=1 Tax=uncultured Microbacterium sp. TaxID=191216 RepID=UPI0025E566C4|nr:hypothetical protein [uncultured Microbacterium sp.]
MTERVERPWELTYDAAQFISLPRTASPAASADWIEACLERFGVEKGVTSPEARRIEAIAQMMLVNSRPGPAQFWFAPPGVHSDLLVNVAVESSAQRPSTEELFADAISSTSIDVTPLRTATHGAGYLIRWGALIDPEDSGGTLVEQWSVVLNDGTWTVLVDVLGTSLPAFLLFEEQLPGLIVGVRVPGTLTA